MSVYEGNVAMGEIKRISVDNVPFDELPDIIRRRIEGGPPSEVRVTVEFVSEGKTTGDYRSFRSFLGSAPGLYSSPQEVVEFIRGLRDESDR